VGISLKYSSRDNTAYYNNIYNNAEYGISATDNEDYTITATNNYWGAASGPYHPTKNPEGKGDNITDYVEFDPWVEGWEEENTEETKRQKEETNIHLWVYIFIIFVLAAALKLSGDHYRKKQAAEAEKKKEEKVDVPSPPQRINTCPHCGGEFEVATQKRPILFFCHFCGKEIEFK